MCTSERFALPEVAPSFDPIAEMADFASTIRLHNRSRLNSPSAFRQASITYAWGLRVSSAFRRMPSDLSDEILCAYRNLVRETDHIYQRLISATGLKVDYVDEFEPYNSADEMCAEVRYTGTLRIGTIAVQSNIHPILAATRGGSYDRFRAVHDVLGHLALGSGFDRNGEYAAWIFQSAAYSDATWRAAGTLLHGENAVLWTTGLFAKHRIGILPSTCLIAPEHIVTKVESGMDLNQ